MTEGVDPATKRWAKRRRGWSAHRGLEIITGSQPVAAWFRPGGRVQGTEPARRMTVAWDTVEDILHSGWRPRLPELHLVKWVPRSLTAAPDLLANMTMDLRRPLVWKAPSSARQRALQSQHIRIIGDGAARANEPRSAFALVIVAYDEEGTMMPVGFFSKFYPETHDAWEMGIEAVLYALRTVKAWTESRLWGKKWKPEQNESPMI